MLTWVRKNTSSIGMIILIGLLILSFAFWDVQSYFNQSTNSAIAVVNGEEITFSEWQQQFGAYKQNMMSQFGENLELDYFDSPMIKRGYLDQIVNAKLLQQAAKSSHFVATPEQLHNTIQSFPVFQNEGGGFDKQSYSFFLKQRNQSPAMFEKRVEEDLTTAALNEMVTNTQFVTTEEANSYYKLAKQKRNFNYFLVKPSDYESEIEPSDDQVQVYYNENASQFMTQEQVAVEYIELNIADIASNIEIPEEDARKQFDDNHDMYKVDEKRKAAHILINLAVDASEADKKSALEEISSIKKQIDAGKSFAEMAKEHSQDKGSALSGGDLGWVEEGDMVAPFEETLFAMQKDTVSEPVLSQFGYHLIQLNEIKEAGYPEFSEVRDEIIAAMQAERSEEIFMEQSAQLSSDVLDAENSLQEVADNNGFEVKVTELFSRVGGEGITANPEFISAAFSPSVKDELLNSDAINISDSHVVYLRIHEHKQPEAKTLEMVKEDIIQAIRRDESQQKAQQVVDDLVEKINTDKLTMAAAAEEVDTEIVSAVDVSRTGSAQPFNLVRNVFKLSYDKTNNPVMSLKANGNDLAIVKLEKIIVPEVDQELDQAELAQLENNIKNNEIQLLVASLRESASIKINEDLLNQ